MTRPTVARVDLEAVRSNFRAICQPSSRRVAQPGVRRNHRGRQGERLRAWRGGGRRRRSRQAGAAMLACADIEEGIVLRRGGVRVPILVFGALSVSDLDGVFQHDLTPTISTPVGRRARCRTAAARHGVVLHCHLKIDTGMNRLGFRHDNLERTMPEVAASRNLAIDAVYTHFATADDPEHPPSPSSASASSRRCARCPRSASPPRVRHAANSAALLRDERVWYDFVRPGLLLYGIVPPPLASTIALRPALSLHSRIVAVKGLRPGEGTGYGMKTVVDRPRTIAVVPAGYADGLDLRLAGRGYMLVRGRRAPIVGSVCMDMTMIDVTGTGRRARRRSRHRRRAGRRVDRTCARWPPRSERFRTSCCAASGARIQRI